jgi:hypothetical protein
MKVKLAILFILDTLVLVLLTYFMLNKIEHWTGILAIVCLGSGVAISIVAFLLLYFKFLELPVRDKKQQ